MEDSQLENNIFGYIINSIFIQNNVYKGVKYILMNSGELLDEVLDPDDSLVKVVLEFGYSFNRSLINFNYQMKRIY